MNRWRWRGSVALLAVALAFVIYPLLPTDDVINSDWPAFATGAQIIVTNPQQLYDLHVQQRYEEQVTHGRVLVTPGIEGILPFLAPAWVALLAVPFDVFGTDLGGRLWILAGLLCLGVGLFLAVRPRPPTAMLPAFAGVPTALMMLNAQLDGFVALGLGAAIALWSRPYLAGIALGLTLMKPQLVLPLGVAVLLGRRWKVLAGWAAAGLVLLVPTLALNPHWVLEWLAQTRTTVAPVSRELNVAHFGVFLPGPGVAVLVALAVVLVVYLAWRRRDDFASAAAILVIGGVLAAPHALAADLVLVAVGLAIWGQASWFEWLLLSVGALTAALVPAPFSAFVAVAVFVPLLLRISLWSSPTAPAAASPR